MAEFSDFQGVPVEPSALQNRIVVAAIDFGTTFSGYAFSFLHRFRKDPLDVKGFNWKAGTVVQHKTATCVLFDPEKKFHSFGFEAEKKYEDLCIDGNEREWYYFRRFKMKLYEELYTQTEEELGHRSHRRRRLNLHRDMMLKENDHFDSKEMKAMDVFSAAIKYLKNHLLEHGQGENRTQADLRENEIHWVLTVPAIWNDAAKQFMREAAIQAGIDEDNLSLALEPEAASLYVKYLPTTRSEGIFGVDSITCFRPGTRYVILDAGGGTVDITAHEVQDDGSLKELHSANGGDWGGVKVDEAYLQFLNEVVGPDVMEVFYTQNREDYTELMQAFELKKRTIKPEDNSKVNFQISSALLELYKELNNGDELKNLTKYQHKDKVTVTGSKLRVDPSIAKGFFHQTCASIATHLEQLLMHKSVRGVDTIIMVGGFSESAMLQDTIKKSFRTMKIIIPQEAGWAVLKGAVIYGHRPGIIASRVCQFTYGIEVLNVYEPALDDPSKRIVVDGRVLCKDRFSKHATIGQEFMLDDAFGAHTYVPSGPDQNKICVAVFRSSGENPRFVDRDCEKIGTMNVKLSKSDSNKKRTFTVQMVFGGTELGVEAVEKGTGKITKGTMEFLDGKI